MSMHLSARDLLLLALIALPGLAQPPAPAPTATPPAPKPAAAPATTAPKPAAKPIPKLVPKKLPKYTLDQISAALARKVPDRNLSRDIKARGVAPDLTRDAIERFRTQGAGPETLAVLEQVLPKGSLLIQADPGASISLDGKPVGVADARGALKLDGLEAGPHQVRVTKELRKDFSQIVNVRGNAQETVAANMAWTVGYLSIDPKQPEARITISDAGTHVGLVQKLPVSVGEHTVTIALPLRKIVRTTVNVKGGEHVVLPVKFEYDPAAFRAMQGDIDKACTAKDYDAAERQIREYQRYAKLDSEMLTCLSVGYLKRRQYDQFLKVAGQSLAEGGEFTFPVMHVHGTRRRGIHDALLTIRQNEIRYEPKGKCNLVAFTRLRKDAQWSEQPQPNGGAEMTLKLQEPTGRPLVMNFVDDDAARLTVIYRLATQAVSPPTARVQ